MHEFAEELLAALFRATLFLSLGTVVLAFVLRFGRLHSPTTHRLAWMVAILLGWLFWSVPIAVSWYEPESEPSTASVSMSELGYRPLDAGGVGGPGFTVPPDSETVGPSLFVSSSPNSSAEKLPRSNGTAWPVFVATLWLVGLLVCIAYLVWCYARLIQLLQSGRTAEALWQQECLAALKRAKVSRSIPLVVTDDFGPALCRLPHGYVLAVPAKLWSGLAREQRSAILTHELAHYHRGDVWKSLGLWLAAVPHWFNPFSWYVVRRFEECGEWACDEEVRRSDPDHVTAYARTLLTLGEVTQPGRLLSTTARGRGLSVRVRRLLAKQSLEDSRMKKLLIGGVAVGLVLACALRFELVAQENADPAGAPAKPSANRAARIEHAEAMVEAVEYAFEAVQQEYELGQSRLDRFQVWSRRWLDAELTLIDERWHGNKPRIRASRAEAFRKHLERMEWLHAKVAELYRADAYGGEASNYYGTKFFVAEAKLWVERAVDNTSTTGEE
jgi:beta-lactamase regulating signal transducer with metallopeptidase domain